MTMFDLNVFQNDNDFVQSLYSLDTGLPGFTAVTALEDFMKGSAY